MGIKWFKFKNKKMIYAIINISGQELVFTKPELDRAMKRKLEIKK